MRSLQNFNNTRHLLIVDALRYSLVLESRAYKALNRSLRNIEKSDDGVCFPSEHQALSAICNAWQMIDFVHRIRGLISQVPGLSQRSIEIQLFKRNTIKVEDFRNLYQHLNSEIPKIEGNTNPIMGVLSWVTKNPDKSITINVGTGCTEIQVYTLAIDTRTFKFASKLQFSSGNKDVDLALIHRECLNVSKHLNSWLKLKGHLSNINLTASIFRFNIDRRQDARVTS